MVERSPMLCIGVVVVVVVVVGEVPGLYMVGVLESLWACQRGCGRVSVGVGVSE